MKYVYPAIFEPDLEVGGYCVFFPDLENVFTEGDDLHDAIAMAEDALCLMLYHMEKTDQQIPSARNIKDVNAKEDDIVTLIACDTQFYEDFYAAKAVTG